MPNAVTSIDIRNPQHLLAMMRESDPVPSFLVDTYFPTNQATDIFPTLKVLIDYKDGEQVVAPFIQSGAKTTERPWYSTNELEPARIAVARNLTLDILNKRGFGEAVFSGASPQERAVLLTIKDLVELKAQITRRTNLMAADCMINDGYEMQYVKEDGTNDGPPITIQFHEGAADKPYYTPATPWDASNNMIMDDLQAMVTMLQRTGNKATDLVCDSAVGSMLMKNKEIRELLDNRRFELGQFEPVIEGVGAAVLGLINVKGHLLRIIEYGAEYELVDSEGKKTMKPYFQEGCVVLTSPATGRCLYGAITQIDTHDGVHVTYAEAHVPKYISDINNDSRRLQVSSKPLLVPNQKGCWVSSKVL